MPFMTPGIHPGRSQEQGPVKLFVLDPNPLFISVFPKSVVFDPEHLPIGQCPPGKQIADAKKPCRNRT